MILQISLDGSFVFTPQLTATPSDEPQIYTHLVTMERTWGYHEVTLEIKTDSDAYSAIAAEITRQKEELDLLDYEVFEILDLPTRPKTPRPKTEKKAAKKKAKKPRKGK